MTPEIRRIVVFGASGFLGRNLLRIWRDDAVELVAIVRDSRSDAWISANSPRTSIRVHDDFGSLSKLEGLWVPGTAIVNCAAMITGCGQAEAEADRVNAILPGTLASTAKRFDCPYVHVSTDGLFGNWASDLAPRYSSVEDAIHPLNAYAVTKAQGEQNVERQNWGSVFRVSFVGPDCGTGRGLVAFAASCLTKELKEITGFVDNWFTPLHVSQLADAIRIRISTGNAKTFRMDHLGCDVALTKFEFLDQIASTSSRQYSMLPKNRRDSLTTNPAPLDQSLRNSFEKKFPLGEVIRLSREDLIASIGRNPTSID